MQRTRRRQRRVQWGTTGTAAEQQNPGTGENDIDKSEHRPRRCGEYERVRAWFVGQGFQVVRDSPTRVAFVVAGTAAQARSALAAPIWLYRARERTYHGPAVDPSLPESIGSSVGGILGAGYRVSCRGIPPTSTSRPRAISQQGRDGARARTSRTSSPLTPRS